MAAWAVAVSKGGPGESRATDGSRIFDGGLTDPVFNGKIGGGGVGGLGGAVSPTCCLG